MNAAHLWWIIPLSLFVGGSTIFFTFDAFYDMTAWSLTEAVAIKYGECMNQTVSPSEYGFTTEEHARAIATFCQCPKLKEMKPIVMIPR